MGRVKIIKTDRYKVDWFSEVSFLYLFLTIFSAFLIWMNLYIDNNPITSKFNEIINFTASISNDTSLSEEEINTVNFNPIVGEGEMGKGVIITAEEKWYMERLFKINSFNLLASDRIPLNRSVIECRSNICQLKKYPEDLPNTSVIIIFHNEAWSVLLRTIWSVINRTPKRLLKEIILVDDASERIFLKDKLDEYIKDLPVSIQLIRMHERKGIVPSRLAGAKVAVGDVLTFLDSHCECSNGWAEPLLERIQHNRNTVVCPVIDIIFYDDFKYEKDIEYHWGAFDWQLKFGWYRLDPIDVVKKTATHTYKPLNTPAMSGGLFAIDRNYFFEMGAYDPDMTIWGGENIEISFRIWQCGGQIEIHPCSHVGHIFRQTTPYTIPGGMQSTVLANMARAGLVWMDEWSDFFFKYNTEGVKAHQNKLNVTERLNLRKRLNCKPFSWYLKNVWPLNFYPNHDRFFGRIVWLTDDSEITQIYDEIKNEFSGKKVPTKWPDIFKMILYYNTTISESFDENGDLCLQANTDQNIYHTAQITPATVDNCYLDPIFQDMFVITEGGHIMTNRNKCLDYNRVSGVLNPNNTNVRLYSCTDKNRQRWKYDIITQQIIHQTNKLCLTLNNQHITKAIFLTVDKCTTDENQKWGFVAIPWHSRK